MASLVRNIAGEHLTLKSFAQALFSKGHIRGVFDKSRAEDRSEPLKIAICVSGGADSMTLAYLLRNTSHPYDASKPAFSAQALIVDHGVRKESTAEALHVRKNLEDLAIESHILRLEWPSAGDMSNKKLEGIMRKKRYQCIATFVQRLGCMDIFTGHHADDQCETLLYRLTRSKNPSWLDLQGLESCTSVPECQSIYGVNARSLSSPTRFTSGGFVSDELFQAGMHMHRPLLSFSKRQIIATCNHFGIPYVNDPTNKDPTYTTRNAIRALREHRLPKAMQPDKLEALQRSAKSQLHTIQRRALTLTGRPLGLDLRGWSSNMVIPIRRDIKDENLLPFRYIMARLIEMISPVEKSRLPFLLDEDALHSMLPLVNENTGKAQSTQAAPPFNSQLVTLRPLPLSSSVDSVQKFQLHRQRMRRKEVEDASLSFEVTDVVDGIFNSQWQLWDNRFWLRLRCRDAAMITKIEVKPLCTINFKLEPFIKEKYPMASNLAIEAFKQAGQDSLSTLPALFLDGKIFDLPTATFLTRSDNPADVQCDVEYARSDRSADLISILTLQGM